MSNESEPGSIYCPSCRALALPTDTACSKCGAVFPKVNVASEVIEPPQGWIRAPWKRRFAAGAADFIPLIVLIVGFSYFRHRFGILPKAGVMGPAAIAIAILLLRDSLRGLSPGKVLMKLRTVRRGTQAPAGLPESILRNLPLLPVVIAPLSPRYGLIGVAVVLAVQLLTIVVWGRGITDLFGGTEVVVDQ